MSPSTQEAESISLHGHLGTPARAYMVGLTLTHAHSHLYLNVWVCVLNHVCKNT